MISSLEAQVVEIPRPGISLIMTEEEEAWQNIHENLKVVNGSNSHHCSSHVTRMVQLHYVK